jgi:hypothetical protein
LKGDRFKIIDRFPQQRRYDPASWRLFVIPGIAPPASINPPVPCVVNNMNGEGKSFSIAGI